MTREPRALTARSWGARVDVHAFGARQQVQRKLVHGGQRAVSARLCLGAAEAVLGVPASAIAGRVVERARSHAQCARATRPGRRRAADERQGQPRRRRAGRERASLRRALQEAFGSSPKEFVQIARFRCALRAARTGVGALGQHRRRRRLLRPGALIAEFGALTGATPRAFLRELGAAAVVG
jgi:hypothetical protein